MAKLYGEIAAKALLTLDKSFARANGQPLDASEVYYSLQAAKDYAATAQAYIGQKIVVIENGVVTHYSVEDTAGNLKELGAKPVADGTTVAIGADGKITLANIAEANKTGTYNAVLVNGQLTWVKPSETTVEGLSDLITALTGRVDTAEGEIDALQAAVGVAAKPETSEGAGDAVAATGLHKAIDDEVARAEAAEKALDERLDVLEGKEDKDTTYSVKEGEKVLSLNGTAFGTSLKIQKATHDDKTWVQLLGINDELVSEFDAAEFVADGFLTNAEYDADKKELVFTWNTTAGISEDRVPVGSLVDTYTNGLGLNLANNEFSVKVDANDKYLTVDETGVHTKGIDDAISAAEGRAATDAQNKADAAKQAAINDAAGKYATTGALEGVSDRVDDLEKIDHSLYATKEELNPVKQTADNAAAKVETLEDKIEEITEVGGEPNVIDYIKVNGTILDVERDQEGKSTKTVNVIVPTKFSDVTDDSGFDTRITANATGVTEAKNAASAAQTTANEAKSAAETNATAIGTLNGTVAGHATTIGEHTTKIANLETFQTEHTALYNSLKSTVDSHVTAIAGKAEQTALDATNAEVAKNVAAIKTLNETTVPSLNEAIDKKADASDLNNYYTKTEIGAIAEGKTIVKMIEDAAKDAEYDDTEVRGLITNNTNAIKAIYDASGEKPVGVLATEIARVEGLVTAEEARAKGIEQNHEGRIAEMETFFSAADNKDEVIENLAEIINYIASDKSGAAEMAGNIQANTDAIKAIYNVAEDGTKDGVLVTEIARVEKKVDDNTSAIAAINHETTGILAQAKGYVDNTAIPQALAAYKVKDVDNTTLQLSETGVVSVKAVSTDLLTQGTEELILNGGTAV